MSAQPVKQLTPWTVVQACPSKTFPKQGSIDYSNLQIDLRGCNTFRKDESKKLDAEVNRLKALETELAVVKKLILESGVQSRGLIKWYYSGIVLELKEMLGDRYSFM